MTFICVYQVKGGRELRDGGGGLWMDVELT